MDVKYLNPIIAATDSVFETMLSLKPEKGKVSFQEELICFLQVKIPGFCKVFLAVTQ